MKSTLKKIAQGLLLVPMLALGISVFTDVAPVAAQELTLREGVSSAQGTSQPPSLFEPGGIFQTIVNILLFVIGAIAVIMLVIGGIRYVVSGGDQSAVTGAKNTILYAIVGIVVAILAFAAVDFVVEQLAV